MVRGLELRQLQSGPEASLITLIPLSSAVSSMWPLRVIRCKYFHGSSSSCAFTCDCALGLGPRKGKEKRQSQPEQEGKVDAKVKTKIVVQRPEHLLLVHPWGYKMGSELRS